MIRSKRRLLIFVEDPGAANFAMPLIDASNISGWSTSAGAHGPALDYLAAHGCSVVEAGTDAKAWLSEYRPDMVVVGTSENPATFAFDLIDAAREASLPSIGLVDGPSNPDYRFRGNTDNPLAHAPDWLLLSDETSAQAFAALGVSPERMVVTGHPYYDAVREEGRRLRARPRAELRRNHLPGAPGDRPVVVFLGEGSDGLGLEMKRRSADYTLIGRGDSDRRTEIVLEEFLDTVDCLNERPYLVFRAHPKDPPERYKAYLDGFDHVSASGPALPMLCACDLVIGLSTSLLVEAALIGLNTLSILPVENQRNLVATVMTGQTPCATSRAELRMLLPRLMSNGSPVDAEGWCATPTGATIRAMDTLASISQSGTA